MEALLLLFLIFAVISPSPIPQTVPSSSPPQKQREAGRPQKNELLITERTIAAPHFPMQ
jgi:hypothetical protein